MHLKLLEDYITLASSKNFSAAARLRNVTHPAFGRRIKALEQWVGASLVQRASDTQAFGLTPAGEEFLKTAKHIVDELTDAKQMAIRSDSTQIRICTGRTLARTMVTDWIATTSRLQSKKIDIGFHIRTASLHEAALSLEADQCHLMIAYAHKTIALGLDQRRFAYRHFGSDKLVPVSAHKLPSRPSGPVNLLQFSKGLALRKILDDGLVTTERVGSGLKIKSTIECDSPDVVHALSLKGLGIAWLPWTLVASDCAAKRLYQIDNQGLSNYPFDVMMYRKKRRLPPVAELAWANTN
jgi:LysR family transcriptional regulator, hypochlorite-specific transcription factor HypT